MQPDTARTSRNNLTLHLTFYLFSISLGILVLLAARILIESTSPRSAFAYSALPIPHSAFGLSPDCDPDWQIVPGAVISPTTSDSLESIAVASANDVWAVGEVKPASTFQTLIEHWDGTSWSRVPSPNAGTLSNLLTGVTALSSTDAWAVGYYSMDATWRTLVQHWDGTSWTSVTSDNVGSGGNFLDSVSALPSGDIWAVGHYLDTVVGADQTLILHSTGGPFTVQTSPNFGPVGNYLSSVEAIAADDVWAVGHYTGPSADRTLTLHWDGTDWNFEVSPNEGTGSNSLHAVTAASGVLWAFGAYAGTGGIYNT